MSHAEYLRNIAITPSEEQVKAYVDSREGVAGDVLDRVRRLRMLKKPCDFPQAIRMMQAGYVMSIRSQWIDETIVYRINKADNLERFSVNRWEFVYDLAAEFSTLLTQKWTMVLDVDYETGVKIEGVSDGDI